MKMAPAVPDAHQGLGKALSIKGDTDGAIAEYRQALALAPTRPVLFDELGVLLAQKQRFRRAEEQFQRGIEPGSSI